MVLSGQVVLIHFQARRVDKNWAQAELGREQVATANTGPSPRDPSEAVIGWQGKYLEEGRKSQLLARLVACREVSNSCYCRLVCVFSVWKNGICVLYAEGG